MIQRGAVRACCWVGLWLWATAAHGQDADAGREVAEHPAPVALIPAPIAAVGDASLPKLFVTLNDASVFALRIGRGGKTVQERVAAAGRALEAAVRDTSARNVRSVPDQGAVIIYVGDAPIIQLTLADAQAADDNSLEVHAAAVVAAVRDAVGREQRRREIANTAFSVSLVVLFGLITVFLLRRFHQLADRGASHLSSPQRSMSSVRVSSVEVIAPGTLRSMLLIGLSVARWLGSIGVVYAWLMLVLSLFETTRIYTEQLAGYVLHPLAALMGRLAASVPTFLVAFVAALAVALLVRFVGLFFASVSRGEASLSWVPPDLAMAFSAPLRVAIVVSALVFAAPIVTGEKGGSLTLLGGLLLIAVALASVPLLANAVIGLLILWRRGVRVGERAELGGIRGRVLGVDLWSVRMEDASGAEVHVPHWLVLTRPTKLFPLLRRARVEIAVADTTPSEHVLACFSGAAGDGFDQVVATVIRIGDGLVSYRLAARSSLPQSESVLLTRLRTAADSAAIVIVRADVVDDLP